MKNSKDVGETREKKYLTEHLKILDNEAFGCWNKKFYFAAAVLYGALLEGYLLLWCLRNPGEIESALTKIKDKNILKKKPHSWKLDELLRVCVEAGVISRKDVDIGGRADYIKEARNLIHPGKKISKYKEYIFKEEGIRLLNAFANELTEKIR